MSKRVRHPMVSFAMFLIVCGVGLAIWEHRHELTYEPANVVLEATVREAIQDDIMETLAQEDCFLGMRGNVSWRPNERRYRLDIDIEEGAGCEANAHNERNLGR